MLPKRDRDGRQGRASITTSLRYPQINTRAHTTTQPFNQVTPGDTYKPSLHPSSPAWFPTYTWNTHVISLPVKMCSPAVPAHLQNSNMGRLFYQLELGWGAAHTLLKHNDRTMRGQCQVGLCDLCPAKSGSNMWDTTAANKSFDSLMMILIQTVTHEVYEQRTYE